MTESPTLSSSLPHRVLAAAAGGLATLWGRLADRVQEGDVCAVRKLLQQAEEAILVLSRHPSSPARQEQEQSPSPSSQEIPSLQPGSRVPTTGKWAGVPLPVIAVRCHQVEMISPLGHSAIIDMRARDPNTQDTVLTCAVTLGDVDIVGMLLQLPQVIGFLEDTLPGGDTALHTAIRWRRKRIARMLIAAGANPNARNDRGETPTMLSPLLGSESVLWDLVESGGRIEEVSLDGSTFLHFAAQNVSSKNFLVRALENLLHQGETSSRVADDLQDVFSRRDICSLLIRSSGLQVLDFERTAPVGSSKHVLSSNNRSKRRHRRPPTGPSASMAVSPGSLSHSVSSGAKSQAFSLSYGQRTAFEAENGGGEGGTTVHGTAAAYTVNTGGKAWEEADTTREEGGTEVAAAESPPAEELGEARIPGLAGGTPRVAGTPREVLAPGVASPPGGAGDINGGHNLSFAMGQGWSSRRRTEQELGRSHLQRGATGYVQPSVEGQRGSGVITQNGDAVVRPSTSKRQLAPWLHRLLMQQNLAGESALDVACREGNAPLVRALVSLGYSVDSSEHHEKSAEVVNPLWRAAKAGKYAVCEALLDSGVNADVQSCPAGMTPLHVAPDMETMKVLVQGGVDVNVSSREGYSPLYYAAKEGNEQRVRALLRLGANPRIVDNEGCAPLFLAACQNQPKVVEVLLEEGHCSPDMPTHAGATPIMIAAEMGAKEALEILLKKGADAHQRDHRGWTALHFAAQENHVDCARMLVEAGHDLNPTTLHSGSTPLIQACLGNKLPVAELLLDAGASVDKPLLSGLNAVMLMANNGRLDTLQLLLQHHPSKDYCTADGWTALHAAAKGNHSDCIRALWEFGFRPRPRVSDGANPLHICLQNEEKHALDTLLSLDPSLVDSTMDGDLTALMIATMRNDLPLVQYLVEKGASCSLQNVHGKRALDLAEELGFEEVHGFLSQHTPLPVVEEPEEPKVEDPVSPEEDSPVPPPEVEEARPPSPPQRKASPPPPPPPPPPPKAVSSPPPEPEIDESGLLLQVSGTAYKRGGFWGKTWQMRFMKLCAEYDHLRLYYYKLTNVEKPRGFIPLCHDSLFVRLPIVSKQQKTIYPFLIESRMPEAHRKSYKLALGSEEERDRWITVIRRLLGVRRQREFSIMSSGSPPHQLSRNEDSSSSSPVTSRENSAAALPVDTAPSRR